jgi:hypothetical protein
LNVLPTVPLKVDSDPPKKVAKSSKARINHPKIEKTASWLEASSNGIKHFSKIFEEDAALNWENEGGLKPLTLSCAGVYFAALSEDCDSVYIYKIDSIDAPLQLVKLKISNSIGVPVWSDLTMNLCLNSENTCDVSAVFVFATRTDDTKIVHIVRSDISFNRNAAASKADINCEMDEEDEDQEIDEESKQTTCLTGLSIARHAACPHPKKCSVSSTIALSSH